jgi:hypothetical protein
MKSRFRHSYIEEASMRHWFGAFAAAGFLSAAVVQVGALPAAADTSSARMLTFGGAANTDKPVILRGAAIAPRPAAAALAPTTPSYEITAGRRLWFFDPATLKIRSCINEQTTTVGVRRVRCYSGSLGGYRRTFGPTFQP